MRRIRPAIAVLTSLLLVAESAAVYCGDFSSSAAGTTGAQFLELPVGARAIAMGTAAGAAAGDASAVYYNPAGLAGVEHTNASLMYASYFGDLSYQFGAAATRLPNGNVLALAIQHLSPGALDEVDNKGIRTGGSLQPRDLAATAAYARRLDISGLNIDIGAAGKYISSRIAGSASTAALDAGLRLKLSNGATLSASLANIGKGLKYRARTESLPASGRIGSAFRLPKNILLAADIVAPRGAAPYLAAGAEYCAYAMVNTEKTEDLRFLLRAGYNGRGSLSLAGGAAGLSAGGGFEFSTWTLDYAWNSFGDLGAAHRISLSKQFGSADYLENRANARARDILRARGKSDSLIIFASDTPAFVQAGLARLHSAPDAQTRVIAEVKTDDEVEVIMQRGDWVEVNTLSGQRGWLHKSVLKSGK